MPSRHYRAHERFSLRLDVAITSIHRRVVSKGVTVDLGIGGMACELDTPLRLDESVQIELHSAAPCVTCGEVAWVGWAESSAVRLGVRFDPASVNELERLLDSIGVTSQVGT